MQLFVIRLFDLIRYGAHVQRLVCHSGTAFISRTIGSNKLIGFANTHLFVLLNGFDNKFENAVIHFK